MQSKAYMGDILQSNNLERVSLPPSNVFRLGWMYGATLVLATACGGAPISSSGPASKPSSAALALALETNAPASSTSPPPPADAEPEPEPEPEPPSPFIAVVQHTDPIHIFPVDGALMVTVEARPADMNGMQVGVLDGDQLAFPERMRLAGYWHHIVSINGAFPGGVQMLATGDTGRTGVAERYTLSPVGWTPRTANPGSAYVGIAAVGAGVLALKTPLMFGDPSFEPLGAGTGPRRKFAPSVAACIPEGSAPGDFGVPSFRVRPVGFGSTKDGTVISVGQPCDSNNGAVEVWKPGQATSEVTLLPFQIEQGDWDGAKVVTGARDDEAYVVIAGAGLVHIAGGTVAPVDAPSGVSDAAMADDGALWVIAGGRPFRRAQDERFEASRLPSGVAAEEMASVPGGRLWVVGNRAIFRLRTPQDGPSGAVVVNTEKKVLPDVYRLPKPGGPSCAENLVVLYGFTKITPDDYDFPLTRKALKGHTEFADATLAVTKDGGKKYLSAQTTSFDQAKELVKVVQKGVHGARPAIVCKSPEIVRPFPFNFATGELAP